MQNGDFVMKRILLSVILLLAFNFVCGCERMGIYIGSSEKIMNNYELDKAEKIIKAICNKDKDSILSFFSINTTDERGLVMNDIPFLFQFEESDFSIKHSSVFEAAQFYGGKKTKKWEVCCRIENSGKEYYMIYGDIIDSNHKKTGLYYLFLWPSENFQKYHTFNQCDLPYGIMTEEKFAEWIKQQYP